MRVLEASDGVGGRVRTDVVEGFRLDRGFQVLLTAYPEARRVLDYAALDLRPFLAGALVRRSCPLPRLADPWRGPSALWRSLTAGVGSLADRLARWRGFRAARPPRLARGSLPAAGASDRRAAARRGLLRRDHRLLLPAVLRRDPARPLTLRLEPDVRLRLPHVGRGRRRPPGGGHGGHPGAAGRAPARSTVRLGAPWPRPRRARCASTRARRSAPTPWSSRPRAPRPRG